MNKQILEYPSSRVCASPSVFIGRFAATYTLPLIYPSGHRLAGEHNFIPPIVIIPCHTPSHTISMIAENAKTDKLNSASSKCYSVGWSITVGFDAVAMCCVRARNNYCNDVSTSLSIQAKTPIDDGSNPSSTIASQLFSIRKYVILPSPIAGLHTNYRSGLALSTIPNTHEVSHHTSSQMYERQNEGS